MITGLQCLYCKHFRGRRGAAGPGYRCTAYPEGIPAPIVLGEHNHEEPFPGDHGIRFEAKHPSRTARRVEPQPGDREALELRRLGYTDQEVAARLGFSDRRVRRAIRRAQAAAAAGGGNR